jgi:hypothetical protein
MPAARQVVSAVLVEIVVVIAAVETAAGVAEYFSVTSFYEAEQIAKACRLKS